MICLTFPVIVNPWMVHFITNFGRKSLPFLFKTENRKGKNCQQFENF